MESQSDRQFRILLILSLAAVLIRLLLLLQYSQQNPFFGYPILDSAVYLDWAESILAGRQYFSGEYHHPPAYPFFLAFVMKLSGGNLFAVLFLQSLLLALLGLLLHWCTKELFGPVTAWIASGLFVLCGPLVFYSMKILSETLYTVILYSSFVLVVLFVRKRKHLYLMLSGLTLGFAFEVRGNAILCMIPAVLGIWNTGQIRIKRVQALALFLIAFSLPIIPVLYRNWNRAHILSAGGANWGENFYFGNNPTSTGSFASSPGISPNLRSQIHDLQMEASRRAGQRLSSAETQKFWMREGLRFIRTRPLQWLKLELEKVRRLLWWREASSMYFLSLESRWMQPSLRLLFVGYGLLVALCILGIAAVPKEPEANLILGFIGAQCVGLLIFWPELRFLIPVLPFVIMIAANVHRLGKIRPSRQRLLVAGVGMFLWIFSNVLPVSGTAGKEAWYTNAASAYFAQGQIERALAMSQKAVETNPHYADAWVNLGAGLHANGDRVAARNAWRHAIELNPNQLTALKNLAITYEPENRELAADFWRRAAASARAQNASPSEIAAIEKRLRELEK